MVETKGKATVVRERFPNYQALGGKENGRDQGKGYSRQRKVLNYHALEGANALVIKERFSDYQSLEGKENGRDQGRDYSSQRKVP
jgi:hypothetical protein